MEFSKQIGGKCGNVNVLEASTYFYLILKLNHAYNCEFLSRLKLSTQCKNLKKSLYNKIIIKIEE